MKSLFPHKEQFLKDARQRECTERRVKSSYALKTTLEQFSNTGCVAADTELGKRFSFLHQIYIVGSRLK